MDKLSGFGKVTLQMSKEERATYLLMCWNFNCDISISAHKMNLVSQKHKIGAMPNQFPINEKTFSYMLRDKLLNCLIRRKQA